MQNICQIVRGETYKASLGRIRKNVNNPDNIKINIFTLEFNFEDESDRKKFN